MAVYNTAPYLNAALASITSQTFQNFELVVLDDGSTDGSLEVLRAYLAVEPRMRLISRPNRGIIATRNELLESASAELVAWMDSDDISVPCRLDLQVAAFDADQALVCIGGTVQCIDPDGNFLNVERYPLDHSSILVNQRNGGAMRFPTTMMKLDIARRIGGFREPFRMGEDFDFLLRLSEAGKMSNLSETLYFYRQHLTSICAVLGKRWTTYRIEILRLADERKRYGTDRLQDGGTLEIDTSETANKRMLASQTYAHWALCVLRNGNPFLAWKYSVASVTARPTSMNAWKTMLRVIVGGTGRTARSLRVDGSSTRVG